MVFGCCGGKKKKGVEKGAAAQPPPPPVVVAQPQPGLREGLARATSTPAPVPQPAAVPQPPPPMKSDGQVAQKVVRKKKVKKPVAPVVAKRVGPPKLPRSRSAETQPTQCEGDEDGRTTVTEPVWPTFEAHLPESPEDPAEAARQGTGIRSLSASEAATSSTTTRRN
ncbi:hypothetical protein AAVH_24903 [Aphelenchoides avenae]|nr:hypothetical protein AAVH_24903 [Aphelenchus avenae]